MEFTPERALVITPHPDDAEVWAGGTIAKWVRAGAEVHYVLCTDGSKGSDDPEADPAELAVIRTREQMDSARRLGVANVVALGRTDGELDDTADFRKELVRQIRIVKPDVVLTTEPYRRNMQWHRDHRIAGQVALDAVFPYSRDHLHFVELWRDEGLEPHKTGAVLFWGAESPNAWYDIEASLEAKVKAVMVHQSQMFGRTREEVEAFVKDTAQEAAAEQDYSYAEAFREVTFRTEPRTPEPSDRS
jgi:LmbE family N-acetylglucosaminyl deacetylase